MGRQSKRKHHQHHGVQQMPIDQLRERWVGKLVQFDVGRGDGLQCGHVTFISDEGDVFVECLPSVNRRVAALAFTPGFLGQVVTLVDEVTYEN